MKQTDKIKRLKYLMVDRGISASELARQLGVNQSTISRALNRTNLDDVIDQAIEYLT